MNDLYASTDPTQLAVLEDMTASSDGADIAYRAPTHGPHL